MIAPPRILPAVIAATLILSGASCEKHSWEETKKLHHLGDGHAEEGDGGDHSSEGHETAGEHGQGTGTDSPEH